MLTTAQLSILFNDNNFISKQILVDDSNLNASVIGIRNKINKFGTLNVMLLEYGSKSYFFSLKEEISKWVFNNNSDISALYVTNYNFMNLHNRCMGKIKNNTYLENDYFIDKEFKQVLFDIEQESKQQLMSNYALQRNIQQKNQLVKNQFLTIK